MIQQRYTLLGKERHTHKGEQIIRGQPNQQTAMSSNGDNPPHASSQALDKNEQNQILPGNISEIYPQQCQNINNKDNTSVLKLNPINMSCENKITFDQEEKKNNYNKGEELQMQDEESLLNSEYVEVILQREGSKQPLEITRKLSQEKEKLERKHQKPSHPEKISSFNHLSSQLISSEIRALEAIREQQLQKPVNLSVLVAGKSSLGKSSFIDAFLDHKFKSSSETSIRGATDKIIEKRAQRKEGKMTFNLTMIDTPGYSDHNKISDWLELIIEYITQKFDEFRELEKKRSIPNPSEQTEIIDPRVHCCLYFLSGPRVSEKDILNVQQIQKYVAVIPILAKGDTFTLPEITQFKEQLAKTAEAHQIHWFDIDSILKEQPENLHKLWQNPFGAIPSFTIISSPSKQRQYTWGICDIRNPEHSDFVLLYNLLIGLFSIKLVRITAAFYKFYLTEKKKKEKESQRNYTEQLQKKGIATAFSVGVAVIGYFALKMFK